MVCTIRQNNEPKNRTHNIQEFSAVWKLFWPDAVPDANNGRLKPLHPRDMTGSCCILVLHQTDIKTSMSYTHNLVKNEDYFESRFSLTSHVDKQTEFNVQRGLVVERVHDNAQIQCLPLSWH